MCVTAEAKPCSFVQRVGLQGLAMVSKGCQRRRKLLMLRSKRLAKLDNRMATVAPRPHFFDRRTPGRPKAIARPLNQRRRVPARPRGTAAGCRGRGVGVPAPLAPWPSRSVFTATMFGLYASRHFVSLQTQPGGATLCTAGMRRPTTTLAPDRLRLASHCACRQLQAQQTPVQRGAVR